MKNIRNKKKLKKPNDKKIGHELKTLIQGIIIWFIVIVALILIWGLVFLAIDLFLFNLPPLFSIKSIVAMTITTAIVSLIVMIIKRKFFT